MAVSLSHSSQDFQPVSTSLHSTSEEISIQTSHNPSDSATILAYLKKIDVSNKALATRVQGLEGSTTGIQSQSAFTNTDTPSNLHPHPPGAQALAMVSSTCQPQLNQQIPTLGAYAIGCQGVQDTAQHFSYDGVMPDINVLCQNPQIFQGKTAPVKKSGRFNTTDTVTAAPELRWPNERFLGVSGKKGIPYDDLSLSDLAVGQLSNVFHIQDASFARQALLQVILVLKDATSLTWEAVRSAWGNSMREVEQGTLSWEDSVQWSLNR